MNSLTEVNDELSRGLSRLALFKRNLSDLKKASSELIIIRGIEINSVHERSDDRISNTGNVICLAAQQMLMRKIDKTETGIRESIKELSESCDPWLANNES